MSYYHTFNNSKDDSKGESDLEFDENEYSSNSDND